MSVEIQRAKELLSKVENLENNPNEIFNLFTDENAISQSNLLYQVDINGKYIIDYLTDIFKRNTDLKQYEIHGNSSFQWTIFVPSLSWRDVDVIKPDHDRIFYFDISERKFQIFNKPIRNYEEIMNETIELRLQTISDWWEKYENFTFINRLKETYKCLFNRNRSFSGKLNDALYMLRVKRFYVESKYQEEFSDIEKHNSRMKKFYEEDIARQKWYREFAPSQIEMILREQEVLAHYFECLGYKENKDLTWD